MLDVAMAPLLWRLDHYAIEMPKTAAPLMKYAERIFSRPAYIEALTPSEKVMRVSGRSSVRFRQSAPFACEDDEEKKSMVSLATWSER
jgi:hypothetical protein